MNKLNTTYRLRLLLLTKKATRVSMFDESCKIYGTGCILSPQSLIRSHLPIPRITACSRYMHTSQALQKKDSYLKWVLGKCGIRIHGYVLAYRGTKMYEGIVDNIDYSKFYQAFNMTDTFFSWFLVTELHVWLLICRVMAEKQDGKELRLSIVNRMWEDVNVRVKLLGNISSSLKRKQLTEISQQFNAAIIEYDEGIMSDDKILAGAIWRIFFSSECNNPEHVETLIKYVRKQISTLDKLSLEDIWREPYIKRLDIKLNR